MGITEIVLVIVIVVLVVWAMSTISHQTRATEAAATAAAVSAAGHTVSSVGLVLAVGVLLGLLLVGGVTIAVLLLRARRAERRALRRRESGAWRAGPSVYWERGDPELPASSPSPIDTLIQLEVWRALREMRAEATPPALPADTEDWPSW